MEPSPEEIRLIVFVFLMIINNVFWYQLGKDQFIRSGVIIITCILCIIDVIMLGILASCFIS